MTLIIMIGRSKIYCYDLTKGYHLNNYFDAIYVGNINVRSIDKERKIKK
jgi:hypothetical protein